MLVARQHFLVPGTQWHFFLYFKEITYLASRALQQGNKRERGSRSKLNKGASVGNMLLDQDLFQ